MNAVDLKMLMVEMNQKPIAYYPIYKDLVGNVAGGVMLSQIMYWWGTMGGEEFWKNDGDFMEELNMGETEFKTAKKKVKALSFVRYSVREVPKKCFYDIDIKEMVKCILEKGETSKLKRANHPNRKGQLVLIEKGDSSEIYTESTEENKEEILLNEVDVKLKDYLVGIDP